MWIDASQELAGRTKVYAVTNGASDLPTFFPSAQVGDVIYNLSGVGPAMWVIQSANPLVIQAVGAARPLRTAAGATTITAQDGIVLMSVANVATLPAATSWPVGQEVTIKNLAATATTITPASGTIDGAAAKTIAQNIVTTVTSNGTNWEITGN